MSQSDFDIGDQNMGPARTELNGALKALATTSSGSSAPATTYAEQEWLDTSATPWLLKRRNAANDAWITIMRIDDSDDTASMDAASIDVADSGGNFTATEVEGVLAELASGTGITRGTPVATTTGAAQGYTGLPSGLNRITFMLDGVSNGIDDKLIRIGDSGGYETSGYQSVVESIGVQETSTAGFVITKNTTSAAYSGFITFNRVDGNTWLSGGSVGGSGSVQLCKSEGTKTLSGTLDRIQIITSAGSFFSGGQINIMHE